MGFNHTHRLCELGKVCNLCEPQFPQLSRRNQIAFASENYCKGLALASRISSGSLLFTISLTHGIFVFICLGVSYSFSLYCSVCLFPKQVAVPLTCWASLRDLGGARLRCHLCSVWIRKRTHFRERPHMCAHSYHQQGLQERLGVGEGGGNRHREAEAGL